MALFLLFGCRTPGGELATPEPDTATTTPAAAPDFGPPVRASEPSDGMFAYTDPGQLPRLVVADGREHESTLPLEHTTVNAHVIGFVAQVRVHQRFHNDRKHPIEVTYTFPLPENSAVDDMRMVIGERTIESEVQTRERARQTYEEARRSGHTAALLEQERPNIFTQSVTNVAPGETIEVEISYLQTLTEDGGSYEFVFPMVVGPRFIPPGDVVSDAARITPPILGDGDRTGHDVSLEIRVETGAPISSFVAPTHSIVASSTASGFDARLRDAQTIPNRDFVLRWDAAAPTSTATMFLSQPDSRGAGHFALVVQPPALDLDRVVGRRELLFVVDRSGSMSGLPLALAKQTLRESLSRLRPVDTFDVIGFESGTERLFGSPRPANEHNLVLAERFIDSMEAGGGTMMAGAVEAALAPKLSPGVDRYVMFLTDGFIGNEQQIFTAAAELVVRARKAGGRARVFGVGIGSAPNRELIAGLSKAGDGAALYVGNREHPAAAVDGYFRFVDHLILDDLVADWGGLAVEEVFPARHVSLFASRSVVMLGRYRGERRTGTRLTATRPGGSGRIEIPVTLANSDHADRVLATLWARAKLAELGAATWDGDLDHEQARDAITRVGLDYRLVTAYTSFVAVDRSRVVGDGRPARVIQPVEVPEDVDAEMAGARSLPVGSSNSRDFTAVVEMAPSASRDAAGISLSGSTGAESHYTVDGANVSNPTYGTVGASIVQEFVQTSTDASLPNPIDGRAHWDPHATLRIKRLSVGRGVDERAIKRILEANAFKLEACYEQRGGAPGTTRALVRLDFDASGELIGFVTLDGSLATDLQACMTAVLVAARWGGLPGAEVSVTLELRVRM
ncbi:VIT and vWA domain-containing protein [Enhygromyxa salina]|uniref:VIT and vWA domain-containing protein n=1 Tax=Enhygromyxa salina TaxID=215803 RepID=UPI000695C73C|nr:VIT and VWA domain-containing protein [Enhygromyxa salina]